jgi:DNA-binding MarR family transcriptional regulator
MPNRNMLLQPARKSGSDEPFAVSQIKRTEIDNLVGFHLRMAFLAVSRHFTTAMAHLDLTQKQVGVLWLIGENPGVSQIALATELAMDRASMMAIIDRLDARELVVRERCKRDGRRQELYLTPKGRRTLLQSKSALGEHEAWLASRFAPDELAFFVDGLKRFQK